MPREIITRRSRAADSDEDLGLQGGTRRSRSRAEDSDDEGREARRSSRSEGAKDATSTTIGRGREGLRRHAETHQGGDFPERFKVGDDPVLVKFVDSDFTITYYEHNLYDDFKDQRTSEGKKRQFSFVCLGDNCPLCEIGDDPKFYALINVVDLSKPSKPALKLWYATPNPGGLIGDEMDDLEGRDKVISDPSLYYIVSKSKQRNGFFAYSLKMVKARDLEEDYNVQPLADDELEDFASRAWTEDVLRITPRKELQEIADELSED